MIEHRVDQHLTLHPGHFERSGSGQIRAGAVTRDRHGRGLAARVPNGLSSVVHRRRERIFRTQAVLRDMLTAEIERQKKPYGFWFEQVTGGFTTTGRRGLQAFTAIPLIVYACIRTAGPTNSYGVWTS